MRLKIRLTAISILLSLASFFLFEGCEQSRNSFVDGTAPAYFSLPIFKTYNYDIIDKNGPRANKIVIYFNRCVEQSSLQATDFKLYRNTSLGAWDPKVDTCINQKFSLYSCLDQSKWQEVNFENDYFLRFDWAVTLLFQTAPNQCAAGFGDKVTIVLKDANPPVLWQWPPVDMTPRAIGYRLVMNEAQGAILIDAQGNSSSGSHEILFFMVDGNSDKNPPLVNFTYPPNSIGIDANPYTAMPLPPHYPITIEINKPIKNLAWFNIITLTPGSSYPPDTVLSLPEGKGGIFESRRLDAFFPQGLPLDTKFETQQYLETPDYAEEVYNTLDGRPNILSLIHPSIIDLFGNRLTKASRPQSSWSEEPYGTGIYKEIYNYSAGVENSYPITIQGKTAPIKIDSPEYGKAMSDLTDLSTIQISGKTGRDITKILLTIDYWINPISQGGLNLQTGATFAITPIPDTQGLSLLLGQPTVQELLPTISKDGTKVSYWSNETGIFQLYLRDLTTGNMRQITEFTLDEPIANINAITISADGAALAFYSIRDQINNILNSLGEIYVWINDNGENSGTLVQLAVDSAAKVFRPYMSADGSFVYFWANINNHFQIMTNSVGSNSATTVISNFINQLNANPISPNNDGSYFAFVSPDDLDNDPVSSLNNLLHSREVFLADRSGNVIQLTKSVRGATADPQLIQKDASEIDVYFRSRENLVPLPDGNSDGGWELYVCHLNLFASKTCSFEQLTANPKINGSIREFSVNDEEDTIVLLTNQILDGTTIATSQRLLYWKPKGIIKVISGVMYPSYDRSWYRTIAEFPALPYPLITIDGDGNTVLFSSNEGFVGSDASENIFSYTFPGMLSSFSASLLQVSNSVCAKNTAICTGNIANLFTDRFHLRLRAIAYQGTTTKGFDEIAIHYDRDGDIDNDGMPDVCDSNSVDNGQLAEGDLQNAPTADLDKDGLNNLAECNVTCAATAPPSCTDVKDPDTDGDGMTDGWEVAYGLNPLLNDGASDLDTDGLTNLFEYDIGTEPNNQDTDGDDVSDYDEIAYDGDPAAYDTETDLNPLVQDTDQDGLEDGSEIQYEATYGCRMALTADGDQDGLLDPVEIDFQSDPCQSDTDGDGVPDYYEWQVGMNPNSPDSDGDGVPDEAEVFTYGTNPIERDSDHDGLDDGVEIAGCTLPTNPDTDSDDLTDGFEGTIGTSPCNPDSDNDGIPDGVEYSSGLDPTYSGDASGDLDGDGVYNLEEFNNGCSITNTDTDYDGYTDYEELHIYNTSCATADLDSDIFSDVNELIYACFGIIQGE